MGIFSRFSIRGGGHRKTPSAVGIVVTFLAVLASQIGRKGLPSGPELNQFEGLPQSASSRGIEIAVEFMPVERPSEPFDNDQPIQCPFPDPSILNDGRTWKERAAASAGQRKAGEALTKPPRPRTILPSISAPEHNTLKLLDECNASGS